MITIDKPPILENNSAEEDVMRLRSYLYSLTSNIEQQLNLQLDQLEQKISSNKGE